MRESWELKKVIDVCLVTDYVANGSFKSLSDNVTYNYEKDYALLLRTTDFTKNFKKSFVYVNEDAYKFLKKSSVYPNDIVICNVGSVGLTFLVPDLKGPMTIGPNSILIRPLSKKELDNKFFYYLFKSPFGQDLIKTITSGTTQSKFNKTNFRQLEIPIPPFQEQKQIVAILDEAFIAIDQAKANVKKNIQNAKELFQSKLNDIFSQMGNSWEKKSLEELATIKSGGTPSRAKLEYWDNDSIAWYSSGELNDLYTTEPKRYITNIGLENSNAKLFPKGSLLIGMYDTAALKMSIIDRHATFNQAICGLEPNGKINLIFILHAINAIKPEILKLRRGVRQKNLNQKKIKEINISIPNLDAQNDIVKKLELFNNKIEELNSRNFEKLNYLSEFKKSILQKAFAGELTNKMAEV